MAANPKKGLKTPVSTDGVVFLGRHPRGMDHGRVILLPEWRRAGYPTEFTAILWPLINPDHLIVLPPARWEVLLRKLSEVSLGNEQAAVLERLIGIRAFKRSLDAYGRFPLSDDAMTTLGLKDEALLVGRIDKFEVWHEPTFKTKFAEPDPQVIKEAMERIPL